MSEICENTTRLNRDGTSRQQRLLEALLPDYVRIDERGMKELIEFIRKLAGEVNFFEEDGSITAGAWEELFERDKDLDLFFNENGDDKENFLEYVKTKSGFTEPHIALFLAFLKLFLIARDDLNKIGKKHLEYYYKEVLRIKEYPAVADSVFMIFKLAKHVRESNRIGEKTQLNSGKDDTGKPRVYETASELVVNHGEVEKLKALFWDRSKEGDRRLYASPKARSSDGEGSEIETDDISWKTFGGTDRPQADVGFAVASPLLYLAEGYRTVTVRLHFGTSKETKESLKQLAHKDVPFAKHAFHVQFSGEEEWISPLDEDRMNEEGEIHSEVAKSILNFVNTATAELIACKVKDDPNRGYATVRPGYAIGIIVARRIVEMRKEKGPFKNVQDLRKVYYLGPDKIDDLIYTFRKRIHSTKVRPDEGTITIVRTLDESQPPVTGYNREVLLDPILSVWPVMKVLLNKEMKLDVNKQEPFPYEYLRNLKLEKAVLNVDVAGVKTNILQNDSGTLDPGKPFQPFGNRPVIGSSLYIGNWEIFQKNLDKLWLNIRWHDLSKDDSFGKYYEHYDAVSGIRQNGSFRTDISFLQTRKWERIHQDQKLFDFETDADPVKEEQTIFLHHSHLGDIQRAPNMKKAELFGTGTQRGFIRLSLQGRDFGHKDYPIAYAKEVIKAVQPNGDDPNIPNEPWTPVISELSIDYRSTVSFDISGLAKNKAANKTDQYFHVYPFGITEPDRSEEENTMLPVFTSEGSLYIGVKNFTGGRNLSLLFQVSEGSADPDLPRQEVHWSYLAGDHWVPFNERQILSDSTNQLLTSGIIRFSVPKNASLNHTLLPENLVWLRVSVDDESGAISDLVDIRAQAVKAVFKDNNNDPNHAVKPLPAGTIAKLKESDSAIAEVIQPFSSFGGAVKEESSAFYTRVSERLRHKRRAVTIWDYERLILQKFPSVYKVKCLNHTIFKGTLENYSEIAPGNVSIIVVSDMINKNAVDPLKPKTSLIVLTEIEEYLEKIKAEHVQLYVKNPLYEEIRVEFNVNFREGIDGGFYQGVLEQEIKSFLSPWAFQNTPDVVFGGRVHQSKILHFVEERPYVDFVTCFKMVHIIPQPGSAVPIKKEKEEAEATTAASVLGSAPSHIIHVLETEECACDDNEVSAFKELETDDCGC